MNTPVPPPLFAHKLSIQLGASKLLPPSNHPKCFPEINGLPSPTGPHPSSGEPFVVLVVYATSSSSIRSNICLVDIELNLEMMVVFKWSIYRLKNGACFKDISVTIWKETLATFDRVALDTIDYPVVLAVTSTKVSIFAGRTQLTTTPASSLYLNPAIPQSTVLGNRDQTAVVAPASEITLTALAQKEISDLFVNDFAYAYYNILLQHKWFIKLACYTIQQSPSSSNFLIT
ncbi:hypothetical protein L1987_57384 [Smallanthus sonchifolius]|uniref:Uncharacterized protein n=1 Tax=Smallanthus sonchifolius TaxID=185202 RepID=A0ACB9DCV8_9ASTR|nr:hypothetical protein L1987_57384 [Smallanthus sonchifolius]